MKKFFEDIFEYLKEISLSVKVTYMILHLTFVLEILWAFTCVRIYHTYVPVESLFDLYVLAFPFVFLFINLFALCRRRVSKFLLMIDLVLEVTYPAFVSFILIIIDEIIS